MKMMKNSFSPIWIRILPHQYKISQRRLTWAQWMILRRDSMQNHDTREITMWIKIIMNKNVEKKIDVKSFILISPLFFSFNNIIKQLWVISFRTFPYTEKKNCFINRGENLFISSGLKYLHITCMQFSLSILWLPYLELLHHEFLFEEKKLCTEL